MNILEGILFMENSVVKREVIDDLFAQYLSIINSMTGASINPGEKTLAQGIIAKIKRGEKINLLSEYLLSHRYGPDFEENFKDFSLKFKKFVVLNGEPELIKEINYEKVNNEKDVESALIGISLLTKCLVDVGAHINYNIHSFLLLNDIGNGFSPGSGLNLFINQESSTTRIFIYQSVLKEQWNLLPNEEFGLSEELGKKIINTEKIKARMINKIRYENSRIESESPLTEDQIFAIKTLMKNYSFLEGGFCRNNILPKLGIIYFESDGRDYLMASKKEGDTIKSTIYLIGKGDTKFYDFIHQCFNNL